MPTILSCACRHVHNYVNFADNEDPHLGSSDMGEPT